MVRAHVGPPFEFKSFFLQEAFFVIYFYLRSLLSFFAKKQGVCPIYKLFVTKIVEIIFLILFLLTCILNDGKKNNFSLFGIVVQLRVCSRTSSR